MKSISYGLTNLIKSFKHQERLASSWVSTQEVYDTTRVIMGLVYRQINIPRFKQSYT